MGLASKTLLKIKNFLQFFTVDQFIPRLNLIILKGCVAAKLIHPTKTSLGF